MTCLKPEGAMPGAIGKDGLDFNSIEVMQPKTPEAVPSDLKNGGRVKAADVRPDGVYLPNNNILARPCRQRHGRIRPDRTLPRP